ncbi:hypothetical protein ACHAXT_004598 [Thalassiosira profunda]
MNAPPPSSALVGYLRHVISGNGSDEQSAGKKRPRPWDASSGENGGSVGNEGTLHKGFIFIPEEQRSNGDSRSPSPLSFFPSQSDRYPVVVPYQCLRIACSAAASGELVRISQYSLIRYRDGRGQMIFSSRNGDSRNVPLEGANHLNGASKKADQFLVIEVHHGSLRTASSGLGLAEGKQPKGEDNNVPEAMNLDALSQREAQVQHVKGTPGKGKKKSPAFGKDPMNLVGVVDAISPILLNDSSEDAFAIMELYQPSTDTDADVKSAVAIIRGEKALCMHPAIHPGQTLALMGVVSRRWKVPDEMKKKAAGDQEDLYQRLSNRIPDRVILITEGSSIHWKGRNGPGGELDPALPSTIESLTSIRGVVTDVHYHFGKSKEGRGAILVVHFVTLKLLTPTDDASAEPQLARIYLPKYAITPNLALGMQPGALLRAVNIHPISQLSESNECEMLDEVNAHFLSFVACLRSTLAVERCTGESYTRSRPSHPWFAAQQKPFMLVPDHTITDICSDPFRTKSSAQYVAEEKMRSQIEPKVDVFSQSLTNSPERAQRPADRGQSESMPSDDTTTMPKLDDLFAHHQRNAAAGKLSKECGCVKRRSNRVNGRENGRHSMRDPYAEFFDHAHCVPTSDAVECGSSCNEFSSYIHHQHSTPANLPLVVELERIRDACARNFIHRVALYLRSNPQAAASGWTSSFFYHGLKLGQVLNDYSRSQGTASSNAWHGDDSMDDICSWGCVDVDSADPSFGVARATIRDDACAIPICEFQNEAGGNHHLPDGSPAWVQIGEESNTDGHAFLFLVDNLVFVGSVHIATKEMVSAGSINGRRANHVNCEMNASASVLTSANDVLSIQECLEQTASKVGNGDRNECTGRLVRQRFNFRKLKQKCYDGWTVVLSHVDSAVTDVMSVASVLQTIEVKVSVPFGDSTSFGSDALDAALERLVNSELNESMVADTSDKVITPDQVTLALAWWSAAENGGAWPLLSGGWDELKDRVFVEKTLAPSIRVQLPLASRSFTKLGYQRFRCNLNEIQSAFVLERVNSTGLPDGDSLHFDQLEPGQNEPVYHCRNHQSPLTRLQCEKGVPSATLAGLHWDICDALKEGNAAHLKPSLLRRVHNPKILGISFCRAHVECTQCFKVLVRSGQSVRNAQRNAQRANLVCPSGCSHSQAAVKWECSAVIDDGTGQAKVYAEREGALLLLGGSLDVDVVETGAWESENGIFFQPALPASSRLMTCIHDATTQARKCAIPRKSKKAASRQEQTDNPPSVFSLLPPDAKAEYLLHQHCRQWYQNHHHRRMDLFVRCKPLSEDATSVNHHEIQVAKALVAKVGLDFGATPTATLPPLKLSLEDACVASEDSSDDNATGWNLLQSMRI